MMLLKVVTDIVILLVCALPTLIFQLIGVPPTRGFFCDDESIRYPFKKSTVPTFALAVVGYGLPISVMVVTEVLLARKNSDAVTPSLCGKKIPLWLLKCYETVGVFCFGAVCTVLITNVGKYSIGRLRPYFMAACDPDVDCSLVASNHTYITNYTCRGSTPKQLIKARLSFPSGHSSFSAYTMLYLAFYIQSRVHCQGSYLLKHAAQLCCFLICWATALSRINDNKHHWSDVTVGLLIGTTVAVITATFLSELILTRKKSSSNLLTPRIDDKTVPSLEVKSA